MPCRHCRSAKQASCPLCVTKVMGRLRPAVVARLAARWVLAGAGRGLEGVHSPLEWHRGGPMGIQEACRPPPGGFS